MFLTFFNTPLLQWALTALSLLTSTFNFFLHGYFYHVSNFYLHVIACNICILVFHFYPILF